MLKSDEKVDPIKFSKRSFRGNRYTSSTVNNPATTEEENNVTIPATSNTGHASLESASSRKQKTVIVASTPEAGITDANSLFTY